MLLFRLLHSLNPRTASAQCVLKLIVSRSYAGAASNAAADIPDQWREGFIHTAPVSAEPSANTTAFGWARKQAPDLPLPLLGKLFRQRQVRLLQEGQVKRISRTRPLQPGDVLLLPKQLQPSLKGSHTAESEDDNRWIAEECMQQAQQQSLHKQLQQQQQQQGPRRQQQEAGPTAAAAAAQQQQQQIDVDQWEQQLPDPWPQQQQQQQQQQQRPRWQQQWQQQRDQQWDQQQGDKQQPTVQHQLLEQHDQSHQQALPQQRQQQQQPKQQQQQQQQQELTVQQVRKWLLASSEHLAVLHKPPGVSLHVQGPWGSGSRQLNPVFAEALGIRDPDKPQLVCGLDVRESGAVVVARHAAAHEWLSAWVSGEPAAVAAAAAALTAGSSSSSAAGKNRHANNSVRARQQQQKLARLQAAAAAAAAGSSLMPSLRDGSSGNSDAAAAGFTAKELAPLQQLFVGVGGLRLQRVFWAVVQGKLPARQSGTLRNRMQRGDISLPALTRYRVMASQQGYSWLELQPLTNRQNQIRVHCAKTLGVPILGDYKYGYRPWAGAALSAAQAVPQLARYQSAKSVAAAGVNRAAAASWGQFLGAQDDGIDEDDGRLSFEGGTRGVSGSGGGSGSDTAAAEPLLLHCREVVLLRPRKAPVRVVAPLPREMRQLLHAFGWK